MQAGHKNCKAIYGLYYGGHLVNLVPKVELCGGAVHQCPSRRHVTLVTLRQ
jgi:hypothetical protein